MKRFIGGLGRLEWDHSRLLIATGNHESQDQKEERPEVHEAHSWTIGSKMQPQLREPPGPCNFLEPKNDPATTTSGKPGPCRKGVGMTRKKE